jgi:hypothetical protein
LGCLGFVIGEKGGYIFLGGRIKGDKSFRAKKPDGRILAKAYQAYKRRKIIKLLCNT